MDTTPEAHKKYVELLRKMSPAQRIARQIELVELARSMKKTSEQRARKP